MSSKNKGLVIGGVFAVLMLAATLYFTLGGSAKKGEEPRFLHCPNCLNEMMYSAKMSGQPCLACGEKGAYLKPTVQSINAPSRTGSLVAMFFIVFVLGEVVVYLYFLRRQAITSQTAVIPRLKCRCPKCKRKIGYPANKVGIEAICPGCRKTLTLPAAAE